MPVYAASKGVVSQLTKSLAVDCAGCNTNINCICPGHMDTKTCADMTRERENEHIAHIPAGR